MIEMEKIDLWLDCDPGKPPDQRSPKYTIVLINISNRTRCKSAIKYFLEEDPIIMRITKEQAISKLRLVLT